MSGPWILQGGALTLAQLAELERTRPYIALGPEARQRMQHSRDIVAAAVDSGQVSYGITTGFGAFANRSIPASKVKELQLNLVRSHSCGVDDPLADILVRRILL